MKTRVLRAMPMAILVVAVNACMAVGAALVNHPVPGYGVSPEAAELMGCDLAEIERRGSDYRKTAYDDGGPGYVVPAVGDTGCDVLAKLGRPDEVRTISSTAGEALHLQYHTGSVRTRDFQAHLVVLELNDANQPVVTQVVW